MLTRPPDHSSSQRSKHRSRWLYLRSGSSGRKPGSSEGGGHPDQGHSQSSREGSEVPDPCGLRSVRRIASHGSNRKRVGREEWGSSVGVYYGGLVVTYALLRF